MNSKPIAGALVLAATAAFAAPASANNSLTFQGVTFGMIALDSDTLQLTIDNALEATGDWAAPPIAFITAMEVKDLGGNVSGGTLAGWTNSDNSLSANGCLNGNTNGACFTYGGGALALTNHMVFTIDFAPGSVLDMGGTLPTLADPTPADPLPHLKLHFTATENGPKVGSLLSQPIPAVPEPGTYALLLAGVGIVGFVARRRRQD
jgi:PEP-CTERM motif